MAKKPRKELYRLLGVLLIVPLFITACGGSGGTSSGGGGGTSVARVIGTVVPGNARAELNIEQQLLDSAGTLVAISNFIIPPVQAQTFSVAGLPVLVVCNGGGTYPGVTNSSGKFVVDVPDYGDGNCTVSINGISLDPVNIGPGETEIKVSFNGNTVSLLGISQKADDSPKLEIEVEDENSSDDDDSSDDGASLDDDDSKDDPDSNDDEDSTDDPDSKDDQDSKDAV